MDFRKFYHGRKWGWSEIDDGVILRGLWLILRGLAQYAGTGSLCGDWLIMRGLAHFAWTVASGHYPAARGLVERLGVGLGSGWREEPSYKTPVLQGIR